MSAREADISLENLLSYANAAKQVSTILESLNDLEYDFLLVPSRGAAPIVDICRVYFTARREPLDARGGLDGMVKSFLGNPLTETLFLPFTADAGNLDVGVDSRAMRRFWCRVVAGMLRDPAGDPFYGLFQFLRSTVAPGFKWCSNMYEVEGMPRGDRFVFIDTAVSGQAICEIMDGFAEAGLSGILYIVVVDENGDKLRPEYKRKLEQAEQAGSLFLVYMRRLFTEDQGPAVSGIWSVVFPEIMEAALRDVPEFQSLGCVGAGLYFWSTENPMSQADRVVAKAIATRRSAFMHAALMPQPDHARLEDDLAAYRTLVSEHELFRRDATLEIARPRVLDAVALSEPKLDISSSHVVRVSVTKTEATSAISKFRKSIV